MDPFGNIIIIKIEEDTNDAQTSHHSQYSQSIGKVPHLSGFTDSGMQTVIDEYLNYEELLGKSQKRQVTTRGSEFARSSAASLNVEEFGDELNDTLIKLRSQMSALGQLLQSTVQTRPESRRF